MTENPIEAAYRLPVTVVQELPGGVEHVYFGTRITLEDVDLATARRHAQPHVRLRTPEGTDILLGPDDYQRLHVLEPYRQNVFVGNLAPRVSRDRKCDTLQVPPRETEDGRQGAPAA
jgi:hypothetical protein